MINKNYKIPLIYQKMSEMGFFELETFLWLNDMEWMSIDKIREYEYDDKESRLIVPFAITGGGDKWVWVVNNENTEYYVGLCERAEINGTYYAKNTEDAILKQIIEYVSDSNFYLNENEAKSYQISENKLKLQLEKWKNSFTGIINNDYLKVIDMLRKLNLKHIKSQYGEWYALLTLEEEKELIYKYIKFDLMDEEFVWYLE
ncbi:hypothetical protein [uncultured Clostridium sp.]|jgi:hypothetical protein|uniref:hypothetical protein n=1 Tax=uncultured Clostridium sp. TaxID=59620 RepID=UPI00272A64B4|nr:hypothetical protein [uncultured Clostridium sp.]